MTIAARYQNDHVIRNPSFVINCEAERAARTGLARLWFASATEGTQKVRNNKAVTYTRNGLGLGIWGMMLVSFFFDVNGYIGAAVFGFATFGACKCSIGKLGAVRFYNHNISAEL